MSYTNTTTHYNWPLPEETDLFNGLDDNQMKEDLDEKIYSLEQQSSGDHEAVTQLNARVTEVEQTVGGYDEEIEQIQGTVAEHAERLVNLTNRQTELSRRLNGKAGESTIAPEYNEEESYLVGDFVYHNNILYKAANASATPAGAFDADDWDIAILSKELGGSTPSTIPASSVTYSDVLTQLGVNNVQAAIVALKTLIDNIGGRGMLDFANASNLSGEINFTTPTAGAVIGLARSTTSNSGDLLIDGKPIGYINASNASSSSIVPTNIDGIDAGSVITSTVPVATGASSPVLYFVPYKTT